MLITIIAILTSCNLLFYWLLGRSHKRERFWMEESRHWLGESQRWHEKAIRHLQWWESARHMNGKLIAAIEDANARLSRYRSSAKPDPPSTLQLVPPPEPPPTPEPAGEGVSDRGVPLTNAARKAIVAAVKKEAEK